MSQHTDDQQPITQHPPLFQTRTISPTQHINTSSASQAPSVSSSQIRELFRDSVRKNAENRRDREKQEEYITRDIKEKARVPFIGYDLVWNTMHRQQRQDEETRRIEILQNLDCRENYLASSTERRKSFEYAKQIYKQPQIFLKFLTNSKPYFEVEIECLELFCWVWVFRMERKLPMTKIEEEKFREFMSKYDRMCDIHYWVAFELCQSSARFYKLYLPKVSQKYSLGEYNKRELIMRLKPFLQWMKGKKKAKVEAFFQKHNLFAG